MCPLIGSEKGSSMNREYIQLIGIEGVAIPI
jgi:hypothetical protein